MNKDEYINNSLELHLFFARIMKEHAFFLEVSFMEKDSRLKKIANDFQKLFSDILNEVIILSDGHISRELLESKELVTDYTVDAEDISSQLSGINIDSDITLKEIKLINGDLDNNELIDKVASINRKVLSLIANFIYFKQDILNRVFSCEMYTTSYPSFITHLLDEANLYYDLLKKIESREKFDEGYIYQQELFWNQKMMEHADFIRGLLDISESEFIKTANSYSIEFQNILKNYDDNALNLTKESLEKVLQFREFQLVGEKGILDCQIKSIIIPLLADHIVREANHFIRILKTI